MNRKQKTKESKRTAFKRHMADAIHKASFGIHSGSKSSKNVTPIKSNAASCNIDKKTSAIFTSSSAAKNEHSSLENTNSQKFSRDGIKLKKNHDNDQKKQAKTVVLPTMTNSAIHSSMQINCNQRPEQRPEIVATHGQQKTQTLTNEQDNYGARQPSIDQIITTGQSKTLQQTIKSVELEDSVVASLRRFACDQVQRQNTDSANIMIKSDLNPSHQRQAIINTVNDTSSISVPYLVNQNNVDTNNVSAKLLRKTSLEAKKVSTRTSEQDCQQKITSTNKHSKRRNIQALQKAGAPSRQVKAEVVSTANHKANHNRKVHKALTGNRHTVTDSQEGKTVNSMDAVYKSFSTIQAQHPNLKIDLRLVELQQMKKQIQDEINSVPPELFPPSSTSLKKSLQRSVLADRKRSINFMDADKQTTPDLAVYEDTQKSAKQLRQHRMAAFQSQKQQQMVKVTVRKQKTTLDKSSDHHYDKLTTVVSHSSKQQHLTSPSNKLQSTEPRQPRKLSNQQRVVLSSEKTINDIIKQRIQIITTESSALMSPATQLEVLSQKVNLGMQVNHKKSSAKVAVNDPQQFVSPIQISQSYSGLHILNSVTNNLEAVQNKNSVLFSAQQRFEELKSPRRDLNFITVKRNTPRQQQSTQKDFLQSANTNSDLKQEQSNSKQIVDSRNSSRKISQMEQSIKKMRDKKCSIENRTPQPLQEEAKGVTVSSQKLFQQQKQSVGVKSRLFKTDMSNKEINIGALRRKNNKSTEKDKSRDQSLQIEDNQVMPHFQEDSSKSKADISKSSFCQQESLKQKSRDIENSCKKSRDTIRQIISKQSLSHLSKKTRQINSLRSLNEQHSVQALHVPTQPLSVLSQERHHHGKLVSQATMQSINSRESLIDQVNPQTMPEFNSRKGIQYRQQLLNKSSQENSASFRRENIVKQEVDMKDERELRNQLDLTPQYASSGYVYASAQRRGIQMDEQITEPLSNQGFEQSSQGLKLATSNAYMKSPLKRKLPVSRSLAQVGVFSSQQESQEIFKVPTQLQKAPNTIQQRKKLITKHEPVPISNRSFENHHTQHQTQHQPKNSQVTAQFRSNSQTLVANDVQQIGAEAQPTLKQQFKSHFSLNNQDLNAVRQTAQDHQVLVQESQHTIGQDSNNTYLQNKNTKSNSNLSYIVMPLKDNYEKEAMTDYIRDNIDHDTIDDEGQQSLIIFDKLNVQMTPNNPAFKATNEKMQSLQQSKSADKRDKLPLDFHVYGGNTYVQQKTDTRETPSKAVFDFLSLPSISNNEKKDQVTFKHNLSGVHNHFKVYKKLSAIQQDKRINQRRAKQASRRSIEQNQSLNQSNGDKKQQNKSISIDQRINVQPASSTNTSKAKQYCKCHPNNPVLIILMDVDQAQMNQYQQNSQNVYLPQGLPSHLLKLAAAAGAGVNQDPAHTQNRSINAKQQSNHNIVIPAASVYTNSKNSKYSDDQTTQVREKSSLRQIHTVKHSVSHFGTVLRPLQTTTSSISGAQKLRKKSSIISNKMADSQSQQQLQTAAQQQQQTVQEYSNLFASQTNMLKVEPLSLNQRYPMPQAQQLLQQASLPQQETMPSVKQTPSFVTGYRNNLQSADSIKSPSILEIHQSVLHQDKPDHQLNKHEASEMQTALGEAIGNEKLIDCSGRNSGRRESPRDQDTQVTQRKAVSASKMHKSGSNQAKQVKANTQSQPQQIYQKVAKVTKSLKLMPSTQEPETETPSQNKQCIALSFEGICASFNPPRFSFENPSDETKPDTILFRDSLVESLVSFKKALSTSVTLLVYTYLSQEVFESQVLAKPAFKELTKDNTVIDRIIFYEGPRFQVFSQDDLKLPQCFLPEGCEEVLWVHPLDMDFNEVLSILKVKKYERLLIEDGQRTVRNLPSIARDPKRPPIIEFSFLVSSLDFDIESGKSASMQAIMSTIQSLYFLGKITHLISQKQRVYQVQPQKPAISYSWLKSFKTIEEHMLLSLVAFSANPHCFHPILPKMANRNHNQIQAAKPITPRIVNKKLSGISNNIQQMSSYVKTSAQQRSNYQSRAITFAESDFNKKKYLQTINANSDYNMARLEPLAQVLEIINGGSVCRLPLSQSTHDYHRSGQATDNSQVPIMSYQQPTISSQGGCISSAHYAQQVSRDREIWENMTPMQIANNQMPPPLSIQVQSLYNQNQSVPIGVQSPRNTAKLLFKELLKYNKDVQRYIKTYARLNDANSASKKHSQIYRDQIEDGDQNRKVLVLDGWLIEKFPFDKL